MSYSKCFISIPLVLLLAACEQQPGEQAAQASGPQLRKITISNPADVDSLISRGVEVIVIEDDFVVARTDSQQEVTVQGLSLQSAPASQEDLTRRLVRIVVTERADATALSEIGLDIWEVRGDTVVGQAFDGYIREIRAMGFPVEIVLNDISELVESRAQK